MSNCARVVRTTKQIKLMVLVTIFQSLSFLNAKGQLLGGELNYQIIEGSSELSIELIAYYSCGYERIPQEEFVSMFESMAKGAQTSVKLEQVEKKQAMNNNAAPCRGLKGCAEAVKYQGTTGLHLVPGGYDLVWTACCVEFKLENVESSKSNGLAIINHISERSIREGNSSPKFMESIFAGACVGHENSSIINIQDGAHQDSTVVVFAPVYSNYSLYENRSSVNLDPTGIHSKPSPPYELINYKSEYSANAPFGVKSEVNINSKEGLLKFLPAMAGKYLIGIGIDEYRDNEKIGSSQRVFITEIE